jgi:nucleoside-diphosphate-sugar epimerase
MNPPEYSALFPLLTACRPRQWPKNLLVFAAPLFAFRFEADVWLRRCWWWIKSGKPWPLPAVTFLLEDLTQIDWQQWPAAIRGCGACVMLQAEIGNTDPSQFERNNVRSTEVVLEQLRLAGIQRLVHVSSSVVNSVATGLYTQTKRSQEELVQQQWPAAVVLRPTLMFGWFDRKHLGWLARFMQKLPLFPIPGSGRFIRQPLNVGDFCMLIQRCLEDP